MQVIECSYLEDHEHEFPDDWEFGGADGCDPGADPRFRPANYYYFDENAHEITVTSHPRCDEEALDYFTTVARVYRCRPIMVAVKRESKKLEMLPFIYNTDTDEVNAR